MYYDVLGQSNGGSLVAGRPYALAISAGSDGDSAARQMARISTGWRLNAVSDPLIIQNGLSQTQSNIWAPKSLSPESELRCKELGGLLAGHILLGM